MRNMFLAACAALLVSLAGCDSGMRFKIAGDGTMTMRYEGKEVISRSSLGLVLKDGQLHAPTAAKVSKGQVTLSFDCCDVLLDASYRENGSLRLSVASIPDEIDGFKVTSIGRFFVCPDCVEAGEYVGAAWHEDGSLVCIQSLNPKTEGECDLEYENNTPFHSPGSLVATLEDGTVYLSCSAGNMTRPRLLKHERWSGFDSVWTSINLRLRKGCQAPPSMVSGRRHPNSPPICILSSVILTSRSRSEWLRGQVCNGSI